MQIGSGQILPILQTPSRGRVQMPAGFVTGVCPRRQRRDTERLMKRFGTRPQGGAEGLERAIAERLAAARNEIVIGDIQSELVERIAHEPSGAKLARQSAVIRRSANGTIGRSDLDADIDERFYCLDILVEQCSGSLALQKMDDVCPWRRCRLRVGNIRSELTSPAPC